MVGTPDPEDRPKVFTLTAPWGLQNGPTADQPGVVGGINIFMGSRDQEPQ